MPVLCVHLLIDSHTGRFFFSVQSGIPHCRKMEVLPFKYVACRYLFPGGVINDIHYHSVVFLVFWYPCCPPPFLWVNTIQEVIVRLGTARCAALLLCERIIFILNIEVCCSSNSHVIETVV